MLMNLTGKIKTGIVILAALSGVIRPEKSPLNQGYVFPVMVVIFGSLMIPFLVGLSLIFKKREIIKPNWNDNLLTRRKPLPFIQFAAYIFVANGIATIISTAIRDHQLNGNGLVNMDFGIGMLIGIQLTLLWIKNK